MVDSSSPGAELVRKLADEGGELGGRGEGRQVGHHGLLLLQAHHHLLHTNQLGGLESDTLLVHITYNKKQRTTSPHLGGDEVDTLAAGHPLHVHPRHAPPAPGPGPRHGRAQHRGRELGRVTAGDLVCNRG